MLKVCMKKSWESNQLRLLNRDSVSLWDTNVRRLRQYLREVLCLLAPFFSYTLCQGTDFVSAGEKTLGLVKLWPDPQWPLFHSLSLCRGCFNYASSFWDNTDRCFFSSCEEMLNAFWDGGFLVFCFERKHCCCLLMWGLFSIKVRGTEDFVRV